MPDFLNFKPFDERADLRVYHHGFLPHWRHAGCTYFVTFRLADSVPRGVVDEWRYERDLWLAARGIDVKQPNWQSDLGKLSAKEKRAFERHFAGRLFEYLDRGCGDCVLRDQRVRDIVASALLHFHRQRLETGDFVIMPNHVHVLLSPWGGFELEDILHSIKSFTANQINQLLAKSGTLWMDETQDHIVARWRGTDSNSRLHSQESAKS